MNRFNLSLAAFLIVGAASASPFSALINPRSTEGNQAWTGGLGLDFNVGASNLRVTSFGAFDDLLDGFTNTIQVGIFDRTTQNLVGTAVSFNGSGDTLEQAWRFKSVNPIFLNAGGQYTLVAVGFGSADRNYNTYDNSSAAVDNGGSLLSFVGSSRYDGDSSLHYPGIPDASPIRYGSANMKIEAVPEPFTMGLGIAAVGLFARRRAKRARG